MINLQQVLPFAILLSSSSNAFQSQLPSRQLLTTKNGNLKRLWIRNVQNDNDEMGEHNQSQNDDTFHKANNNRRSFIASTAATILSTVSSVALTNNNPALAATAASTTTADIITPAFSKEVSWPLGKVAFSLLPLAATSTRRATVEECLVEDMIWTHDQIQGVVNVNVPVRQIVVKVRDTLLMRNVKHE